jgi:uncharacterized protein (DUF2342 family)
MVRELLRAPGWADAGRLVARVTMAGPPVSATGAAVSVARLRRASHWSDAMLAPLSGLEEASGRVAERPTVVVDRRGALSACGRLVDELRDQRARTARPRPALLSLAGPVCVLHTVGPRLHSLWDPVGRRRLLVAPNVVATADRASMDQIDFSRWVALRAGLWGVLHEQAPWLAPHLSHLIARWPSGAGDLTRLALVLDQVVTCEMDALTPQDISSVRWIRRTAQESMVGEGLSSLRRLGAAVGDVGETRARAHDLARVIVGAGGQATLLRSADHLPTAEEFDRPAAWLDRVGL